jgi:hypothetical protein
VNCGICGCLHVWLACSPLSACTGTAHPVVNGSGYPYVALDTSGVLNNPEYETVNSVLQLEVDYQTTTDGAWAEAYSYPEYIGGDNDPVLMTKQVYADGSAVSGASLEAYAVPIGATGNGVSGYPSLASGITADDGTIHMAPLDLAGVQQNSTYEGSDDTVDVRIEYDACATGDDSSSNCSDDPPTPDWQYAMDVTEYFGTEYNAVVAQQQVVDSTGAAIADQPVTVEAVSQDGTSATDAVTGETDPNGYVHASLNLTDLQGDADFQDQDTLGVNLAVVANGEGPGLYHLDADSEPEAGADAAEPLATAGLVCNSAQNILDDSAAQANACGDSVLPLADSQSMPSGGTVYHYIQGGGITNIVMPPASFDPASASDEVLSEYGYPPRPADTGSPDYADWLDDVESGTFAPAPLFILEPASGSGYELGTQTTTSNPTCSPANNEPYGDSDHQKIGHMDCTNYAGYIWDDRPPNVTKPSNALYGWVPGLYAGTGVAMTYIEPSVSSPVTEGLTPDPAVAFWTGMNAFQYWGNMPYCDHRASSNYTLNTPLGQIGTLWPQDTAFWEMTSYGYLWDKDGNCKSPMLGVGTEDVQGPMLKVAAGDEIHVHVTQNYCPDPDSAPLSDYRCFYSYKNTYTETQGGYSYFAHVTPPTGDSGGTKRIITRSLFPDQAFSGNNVEWLVERPAVCCDSAGLPKGVANLAHFGTWNVLKMSIHGWQIQNGSCQPRAGVNCVPDYLDRLQMYDKLDTKTLMPVQDSKALTTMRDGGATTQWGDTRWHVTRSPNELVMRH